ncbi:hypothetical protein ACQEVI_25125 [Promicromonospora sp. CA-289599]|uniref:hypothetical protein n=1 Tax=Promicromonospora sp. CA-289599 TaxID=3240014 RepID=UPI003D8F64FC
MKSLGRVDATKRLLLEELRVTEQMLASAATKESRRYCDAQITTLPDLGLPYNVRRMHGGFFTGACYQWESDVPLVPIDATVNVCGVSIFRTDIDISSAEHFRERIDHAKNALAETTPFVWNFTSGHHFIILAESDGAGTLPAGRYIVLHASTAEFKAQFNGLYPGPTNWYSDAVKTLDGENGRYLRYLAGRPAEEFYRTASMLESYQRERQRICAALVVGNRHLQEEILSLPHYGMPDQASVAIGCQWVSPASADYVLLTRPRGPIFLLRAREGGSNTLNTMNGERLLAPHGLGVRAEHELTLGRTAETLVVSGQQFPLESSLVDAPIATIREFDREETMREVTAACPSDIEAELVQIHAYFRTGTL